MGYMSEVALSIKHDVLKNALAKLDKKNPKLAKEVRNVFVGADHFETKEEWSLYVWEYCKWHDDGCERKDLHWIRRFMEDQEDKADIIDDLPFRFVRLGESFMDNEVLGTSVEPFRVGFVKKIMHQGETIH